MDCNNYSYINYSGQSNVIAQNDDGTVELCYEVNWFGDKYYIVMDELGDFIEEFPATDDGYQDAVMAFHQLVRTLRKKKEV